MTDSYIVELKYCKFIEGWIWCYVRSCWSNSVRNHVKNRSLDLYQVCGFLLLFARNDGNVHWVFAQTNGKMQKRQQFTVKNALL